MRAIKVNIEPWGHSFFLQGLIGGWIGWFDILIRDHPIQPPIKKYRLRLMQRFQLSTDNRFQIYAYAVSHWEHYSLDTYRSVPLPIARPMVPPVAFVTLTLAAGAKEARPFRLPLRTVRRETASRTAAIGRTADASLRPLPLPTFSREPARLVRVCFRTRGWHARPADGGPISSNDCRLAPPRRDRA